MEKLGIHLLDELDEESTIGRQDIKTFVFIKKDIMLWHKLATFFLVFDGLYIANGKINSYLEKTYRRISLEEVEKFKNEFN